LTDEAGQALGGWLASALSSPFTSGTCPLAYTPRSHGHARGNVTKIVTCVGILWDNEPTSARELD